MLDARIDRSVRAECDLEGIFDYIAAESGRSRALNVLNRLNGAMALLETSPRLGRVRTDLDGAPRSLSVKPWLIFYDVLADDSGVLILRIIDGRRDLSRL